MAVSYFKVFRNLLAKSYSGIFLDIIKGVVADSCPGCNGTGEHTICMNTIAEQLVLCMKELVEKVDENKVTEEFTRHVQDLGLATIDIPDCFLYPDIRRHLFNGNDQQLVKSWENRIVEYTRGAWTINYL